MLHLKDLLGSIARVGYCIPVLDFYLVLHGLLMPKEDLNGLIKPSEPHGGPRSSAGRWTLGSESASPGQRCTTAAGQAGAAGSSGPTEQSRSGQATLSTRSRLRSNSWSNIHNVSLIAVRPLSLQGQD